MTKGTGRERGRVSRELSMLAFNGRVLHEASDARNPLLNRFAFLGIVASNLDEFYGVRVSGIQEQRDAGVRTPGLDGMLPAELLNDIARGATALVDAEQATWRLLLAELKREGHALVSWDELTPADRVALQERFRQEVLPVLTPLAVDPGHPFPFISSLSLSLAIRLRDPEREDEHFARVKVPGILGRVIQCGAGQLMLVEELIRANLDALFPGLEILDVYPFRVTRDADIEVQEGEADDLLSAIEEELRQRRFGHVVRLELQPGIPDVVRDALLAGLEITEIAIQIVDGPLDLTVAAEIANLPLLGLKATPWQPVTPHRITNAPLAADGGPDLFSVMSSGDLLVHHPYESFDATVDRLFAQAADDPSVLSIRATLYRTGVASSIATHLIRAAQSGKEVVVLVELKARFDEAANIRWARRLEEAGAHVIYGMMGLKTHGKATLIARREPGGVRRYTHLATGNYNAATARVYTDLGLFTANDAITADVGDLFNYLTGLSKHPDYRTLLVAPKGLRGQIRERILRASAEAKAGRAATIFIKVNALIDLDMIDLLDAAVADGVRVDLVVRGMCGLLPDPARHGDRLRIRSIVGEFLEHSRMYRFTTDAGNEWLIGSADLMERNLDRRVEVLFPLLETESRRRADEIAEVLLADTRNAWTLNPDGAWVRLEEGEPTRNEEVSNFRLLKAIATASAARD